MNPIQFKIRAGSLADAQAEWDRQDLQLAVGRERYEAGYDEGFWTGCVLTFLLCGAVGLIVFTLMGGF